MAKSNPYQETISLGKKIVSEFSDEEIRDTTLQWMAHYLAELIQGAEREKSLPKKRKLQKECVAVIEDIWKKRAYFRGNTRPLTKIGEVIPILKALRDNKPKAFSWSRFIDHENDSPWGEYIKKIRHNMDDILAISLSAAVTQQALLREKEWLDHSEFLSADEKKIIEHLDYLLTKSNTLINIIYVTEGKETETDPKSPPDKMTQVFEKLVELNFSQNKYLEDLRKKLQPTPFGWKKKRKGRS